MIAADSPLFFPSDQPSKEICPSRCSSILDITQLLLSSTKKVIQLRVMRGSSLARIHKAEERSICIIPSPLTTIFEYSGQAVLTADGGTDVLRAILDFLIFRSEMKQLCR